MRPSVACIFSRLTKLTPSWGVSLLGCDFQAFPEVLQIHTLSKSNYFTESAPLLAHV